MGYTGEKSGFLGEILRCGQLQNLLVRSLKPAAQKTELASTRIFKWLKTQSVRDFKEQPLLQNRDYHILIRSQESLELFYQVFGAENVRSSKPRQGRNICRIEHNN